MKSKITSFIYKSLLAAYYILPLKKQLCFVIKRLKIPYEKFYKDIRFHGQFKVRIDNREFRLMNYGYTTIENEIFWRGISKGWEEISIDIWVKLAKRSKVIFDIGANTGIYSLIAKTVHPDACVYAFEPSERVYEKLIENNRINGYNIQTEKVALSNKNGELLFFDVYSKHQYSASLSEEMKEAMIKGGSAIDQYPVKTQTLKNYIEEYNIENIDLIKLDVELHEYEVLEGFENYLERFKPDMLIEILTDEIAKKIEQLVENKDYLYFSINEQGEAVKKEHLFKSESFNYLICSAESATHLELRF
jgi:FkbM family methyltransferase